MAANRAERSERVEMTELNLSGQTDLKNQINPKLVMLKSILEQRKPIWDKVSVEKKKKWIQSGKDPIMTIAWQIYRYLRDNFFGEVDE